MKFQFRFRIIPTLATVALLPVLIGLGVWQLDRAQQKTEIENLFQKRSDAPAVVIGSVVESPQELEYRRLKATGTWDAQHEFLLDNRVRRGQPGFHVITPLIFRGGQSAVLVNRGWIPGSPDRSQLPKIDPLSGDTNLTGLAIIPPVDTFVLKQESPVQTGEWPLIWQTLDIKRFSDAVPYEIQGVVIQLDDDHPAGFERQWPPPDSVWITRHRAYAFQWFALSATLLVIYFLLTLRPRRD